MDFCKLFNAQTAHYVPGTPIQVKISVYSDKTFTFTTASPTTSHLLKAALGVDKLSARPSDVVSGTLSRKHIYHIAEIKATDYNLSATSLRNVCSRIMAQAVGVGIKIVD
jgi:large subunit ribosomal protein L11